MLDCAGRESRFYVRRSEGSTINLSDDVQSPDIFLCFSKHIFNNSRQALPFLLRFYDSNKIALCRGSCRLCGKMENKMYMHAHIFQVLSLSPSLPVWARDSFPIFPLGESECFLVKWRSRQNRGVMLRIGVCLHLENAASIYIESSYSCFQMNVDCKLVCKFTNDQFLWCYHRQNLYI